MFTHSSIIKQFYFKLVNLACHLFALSLKVKILVLMSNCSNGPLDRTLSGAKKPNQSQPGSDGKEWVLRIPQNSSITGTSPSDCFVSFSGHPLGETYSSAENAVTKFYSLCRLSQTGLRIY